jgi:hypothetical protein
MKKPPKVKKIAQYVSEKSPNLVTLRWRKVERKPFFNN